VLDDGDGDRVQRCDCARRARDPLDVLTGVPRRVMTLTEENPAPGLAATRDASGCQHERTRSRVTRGRATVGIVLDASDVLERRT
jgi:hypothetical protein